jgi:hypothetical protein
LPSESKELEFEEKNKKLAVLFISFYASLFFGYLGIDRFLQGKIKSGMFKLLFFLPIAYSIFSGNFSNFLGEYSDLQIWIMWLSMFVTFFWWILVDNRYFYYMVFWECFEL